MEELVGQAGLQTWSSDDCRHSGPPLPHRRLLSPQRTVAPSLQRVRAIVTKPAKLLQSQQNTVLIPEKDHYGVVCHAVAGEGGESAVHQAVQGGDHRAEHTPAVVRDT